MRVYNAVVSCEDTERREANLNKKKLVGVMYEHGDTQAALAEYLGISKSRLNAKLNETNGAEFTQREIKSISEKYAMSADQICEIFFATLVS